MVFKLFITCKKQRRVKWDIFYKVRSVPPVTSGTIRDLDILTAVIRKANRINVISQNRDLVKQLCEGRVSEGANVDRERALTCANQTSMIRR